MKAKINRWNLQGAAVFLPVIRPGIRPKTNTHSKAAERAPAFRTFLLCGAAAALWATPGTANAAVGYPYTTVQLGGSTTVLPDPPLQPNTTSINVSAASTDFKGLLEASPITGVVRVTNAHPAGNHFVLVHSFDHDTLISTKFFLLTVTTPGPCFLPQLFEPRRDFPAGTNPRSVAIGDFNRDGFQDLAVAGRAAPSLTQGRVSILLGRGTGNFFFSNYIDVGDHAGPGSSPNCVVVGDFNGDGKQDLATANSFSNTNNNVSVLLGIGNGGFMAARNFAAGIAPSSLVVGDFNGDHRQDLAVVNEFSSTVSVLLGTGNGNFLAPINFRVGTRILSPLEEPYWVAVGDFDSDNKQDLAVTIRSPDNNVTILLNTTPANPPSGMVSFANPAVNYVLGDAISVAVGKFDNNIRQDLVTVDAGLSILLGSGAAGSFGMPTIYGAGAFPRSVAIGDLANRGVQDLAIANSVSNDVSVAPGRGDGVFDQDIHFESGESPRSVAVGDFNRDGSQDLVSANYDSNSVSIFLNDSCRGTLPTPTPPPTPPPNVTPDPGGLSNLSIRLSAQTGDNAGIGGFIIAGSAPKHVLLRAIGPSLTHFGVPDVLADPVLELHGPAAFATITNNNWRDTQEAEILATGIAPTNDLESAIDVTLDPGAYSGVVRGNHDSSGVALVEVYDLDQAALSTLANISTRAFVGTGDNIVIAGFTLGNGGDDDRIVVRGIGPSLTAFGVVNALANPTLELRDGNGVLLVTNNDWQDNPSQAAELTAAGLAPTNPLESGIAATLPPGAYTALLAGLNNGAGIGVVEVYDRGAP